MVDESWFVQDADQTESMDMSYGAPAGSVCRCCTYLASVMDGTTVFETVRRGSTPWRGTVPR